MPLRWTDLAIVGIVLMLPHAARATEPTTIALTYEAPHGCPSQAALESEVRTRVPADWLTGADARTFDARIERREGGAGFTGRLTIGQRGRPSKTRAIEASTCPVALTSLAVFLALALDPTFDAGLEPEPGNASPPPPLEPPPALVPRGPPTRAVPRPPRPPPRKPPTWSSSSSVVVEALRLPEIAWGARVNGELARGHDDRRMALALRVSWGFSRFSTFPDRAGEARFLLRTLRPEGCVRSDLRPWLGRVSIEACAGLDVGTLEGHADSLRGAVAQTVRWLAVSTRLRASVSLLPWLSVSVEGAALVPLERTTFALTEPSRLVFRAPAVVLGAGAGLGVTARFP